MTRRLDIVDIIQAKHRRLILDQYNGDPKVIDRQFRAIEAEIRTAHGSRQSFIRSVKRSDDAERNAAIRDRLRKGAKVKNLADIYGLSDMRIRQICAE